MAAGVEAQIARALLDHLKSLVLSPALPVKWEDVRASQLDAPYLEPRIFRAPTQTVSIPSDSEDNVHTGFLQVDVVYPENSGAILPAEQAALVISHFKRGTVLQDGATRVEIILEPYLMSMVKDPPNERHPVTIRYQAYGSH